MSLCSQGESAAAAAETVEEEAATEEVSEKNVTGSKWYNGFAEYNGVILFPKQLAIKQSTKYWMEPHI